MKTSLSEIVLSHRSKGIFGFEEKSHIPKGWLFGCLSSGKLACSLTAAKDNAASTFLLAVAQLQADEFVV
jgi:hypothetical protein